MTSKLCKELVDAWRNMVVTILDGAEDERLHWSYTIRPLPSI